MTDAMPMIPWWRVQLTEHDAQCVADAVRHEHLSLGVLTAEFEKQLAELLSVPYVVATTSGSMALLMSLIAIDLQPGDEVIIPNRTWIAAAHAVVLLGGKVVLVDVRSDIPIIDIALIEEKITPRTKAIIPTSLNGRAVDMAAIQHIAARYHLQVIEDAAQALFSQTQGQYIGSQATLSCFSLSVAKFIPTGQGGFVATSNGFLYDKLRAIRTHGVQDLLQCHFSQVGFNFRFTDLQAALGLAQLKRIKEKIAAFFRIYHQYEQGLKNCTALRLIPVNIQQGELPLYSEVLTTQRDQLMQFLNEKNIQTKAFYPNLNRAAYLQDHYRYPQADRFELQGLTLPCGPDQSVENIERVLGALQDYEKQMTYHSCLIA